MKIKLEVKAAERSGGDVDYNNSPGELKGHREIFDGKKKKSVNIRQEYSKC